MIAVAARRRRILRKLEDAGADRPERARTMAELSIHETHLASRLTREGVLVTEDGARFFLSANGIARWKQRRNNYVLSMLAVLAVVAIGLLFFLRSR